MESGGRQSRLLGRLLGKLRGEHHKCNTLDKHLSFTSGISESTGCGSITNEEDDLEVPSANTFPTSSSTANAIDDDQFAANIDQRYGGQYLTPQQLPEFCDQLHHLVEVIRNIQSYAKVTGEYPTELERRLEREAREVASLAAEARNARDAAERARAQRRALRAHRDHLMHHLTSLKDTEVRELESTVRLSDRKLFKNWESLKDSTDHSVFEPLLDEIRNKQSALECLVRLVQARRSALARPAPSPPPPPQPLPPPLPTPDEDDTGPGRQRCGGRRGCKRRRRSEPVSGSPSRHAPAPPPASAPTPQVTLYIQGSESTSRYRAGSAGAVALPPLDLPSGGSVRDILFFTTN